MNIISIPGFTEPFNSISHLVGAFVFLIYGGKLLSLSRGHRGWVFAVAVYIFSVVFLLSMSGVFHMLDYGSSGRAVLQRLDHAGIFALIAGTFTPVHSILFTGFWRWGILLFIWIFAILGITLKSVFFSELNEWVGLIIYLGFGWVGIITAYLTYRLHGFAVLKPLIYGALAYTVGACLEFFRWPVVVPGVVGPHELFHIAVIAGIAWHWHFVQSLLKLKQSNAQNQLTEFFMN